MKLSGTNQLLAYAGDANLLGDNIDTIKKNTEPVIDANKEIGLQIKVSPECRSKLGHENGKQTI
jgi:hypothetical protein